MRIVFFVAMFLYSTLSITQWEYLHGNLGRASSKGEQVTIQWGEGENHNNVTRGVVTRKRQDSASTCTSTLCVEKVTPATNANARNYYATYTGVGSVLLFWKFTSAEQGLSLTSSATIQRGDDGEAYVTFRFDKQVTNFLILSAEITAATGETWSIPSYSWVYATLWESLCLDNGDLCLQETLSPDYRARAVVALNYRYIECSLQIKIKTNTNTRFQLYNGTEFTTETVVVAPRRLPGAAPVGVAIFTAIQESFSDGWMYSFEFYGRRGDHRAVSDAYKYDLPFVGKYIVNQGYGGVFSHTGWSEYAIDWNLSLGTPVYAARDGVVANVKVDQWLSKFDPGVCPIPVDSSCSTPGSDANGIIIRHSDGTWALYAHLKQNGAVVSEGQIITGKTIIGYSGNTGYSSGPHLHFQVTKASIFDHPLGWISETLYVQYVDRTGKIFVPTLGGYYSATQSYPKQPPTAASPPLFPTYPPEVNVSHLIWPNFTSTPSIQTVSSGASPSTGSSPFEFFTDMFSASYQKTSTVAVLTSLLSFLLFC